MRGFGTMVSFEVAGGASAAEAAVAAARLATPGTSLGGVETLIERRGRWEGEGGLPPGLVRMSVGIEDLEDLWSDLDAALRASAGVRERSPLSGPGAGGPGGPSRVGASAGAGQDCDEGPPPGGRRRAGSPAGTRAHVGLAGLERVDLAHVHLGPGRSGSSARSSPTDPSSRGPSIVPSRPAGTIGAPTGPSQPGGSVP